MKKFAEAIRSEGVSDRIGRVAIATFILGAVITIFAIISTFKVRTEFEAAFHQVRLIRDEQSLTQDILAAAVDSETALRGYGLTRDLAYLAPLTKAREELPRLLDQIALIRSNPTPDQTRFDAGALEVLTTITKAVERFQADPENIEALRADVGSVKGKLDEMRRMEQRLNATLSALLDARRDDANITVSRLLKGVAVFAIGLVLLSFTQLREMALQAARFLRSESRAEAKILDLSNIVEMNRQELESLHRQLAITLRSASVQIFTMSREGHIGWVSDTSSRIQQLNHCPGDITALARPEDVDVIKAALYDAFDQGVPRDVEVRLGSPSTKTVWLRIHIAQPENSEATLACAFDITDLKAREENNFWLMRELSHRSKNLLAIVQSIARQTGRNVLSVDGFLEKFATRLQALAASHDLLVKTDYVGANLGDLIRSQMIGYDHVIGTRVLLSGPDVIIRAEAAQNLGMAFHELAANAMIHGALSNPAGKIEVRWSIEQDEKESILVLDWHETNARPSQGIPPHGFGGILITINLPRSLEGTVTLDHGAEGTCCHMRLPMRRLLPEYPERLT